jgi:hypothetical protein
MTQRTEWNGDKRVLTAEAKAEIEQKSRAIGGILIRLGRAYVAAVRAPSREENVQAEERFFDALNDLATICIESDFK